MMSSFEFRNTMTNPNLKLKLCKSESGFEHGLKREPSLIGMLCDKNVLN